MNMNQVLGFNAKIKTAMLRFQMLVARSSFNQFGKRKGKKFILVMQTLVRKIF